MIQEEKFSNLLKEIKKNKSKFNKSTCYVFDHSLEKNHNQIENIFKYANAFTLSLTQETCANLTDLEIISKIRKFLINPYNVNKVKNRIILSFLNRDFINEKLLNLNGFNLKIEKIFYLESKIKEKNINKKIIDNNSLYDLSNYICNQNEQTSQPEDIKMSFSLKQIFDTEYLGSVYHENGLDAYLSHIKKLKNDNFILNEGKYFKFFEKMEFLSSALSDHFNIQLNLISKNEPFESRIFMVGQNYHNIGFNISCFTGGESRAYYNKLLNTDICFCSSNYSKYEHEMLGLNAVNIKHFDYLIDDFIEKPTFKNGINLINLLLKERKEISIPMELEKYLDKEIPTYKKRKRINELCLKENHKAILGKDESQKNINLKIVFDIDLKQDNSIMLHFQERLNRINRNLKSELYDIETFWMTKEEIANQNHNADVIFSNSEEFQISNLDKPIVITNNNILDDNEIKSVRERFMSFVFDLDEVVTKGEEKIYQEYSLAEFLKSQSESISESLSKGLFFNFFYKLGKIAYHFKNNKSNEIDIDISILTARGGDSSVVRVFNLIESNQIYIDKIASLNGMEKTKFVEHEAKKGGFCFYIDDHPLHTERVLNLTKKNQIKNIIIGKSNNGINIKQK